MAFTSLADVEAAMRDLVSESFFRQPFFRDLAAGRRSEDFLRTFADQYGWYSAHFPRVLGAAIAAVEPEDEWWIPLADNLWDEAGRGVPGRSHAVLYRAFRESVGGVGDPEPMGRAVRQALETWWAVFRTASPLEVMAAVGLGSEFFAGDVMGWIGRGLRHPAYQGSRPIATTFWDVHAGGHEPRHYRLCRQVLERYTSREHLEQMWAVGSRVARSEAAMYQSLYAEQATCPSSPRSTAPDGRPR